MIFNHLGKRQWARAGILARQVGRPAGAVVGLSGSVAGARAGFGWSMSRTYQHTVCTQLLDSCDSGVLLGLGERVLRGLGGRAPCVSDFILECAFRQILHELPDVAHFLASKRLDHKSVCAAAHAELHELCLRHCGGNYDGNIIGCARAKKRKYLVVVA